MTRSYTLHWKGVTRGCVLTRSFAAGYAIDEGWRDTSVAHSALDVLACLIAGILSQVRVCKMEVRSLSAHRCFVQETMTVAFRVVNISMLIAILVDVTRRQLTLIAMIVGQHSACVWVSNHIESTTACCDMRVQSCMRHRTQTCIGVDMPSSWGRSARGCWR